VKSKTELVDGGQSLSTLMAGAALMVVAKRAMETAETSAVKETIFV
jgi:hypothetical protein